jgi:hypothetical protein
MSGASPASTKNIKKAKQPCKAGDSCKLKDKAFSLALSRGNIDYITYQDGYHKSATTNSKDKQGAGKVVEINCDPLTRAQ